MKRPTPIVALFLVLVAGATRAEFKPDEPLLTPGGFSTADTLRKSEWLLSSPPWGWMAYGVTDRLTLVLDYQVTLFGYPAALLRYRLTPEDSRAAYAVEAYGLFIPHELKDERQDEFKVIHQRGQAWLRLNRTQPINANWRTHLYAGANFTPYQKYAPYHSTQFPEKLYRNAVSPNVGGALEWTIRPWIKANLNVTYGNTFSFYDQIAYKTMVSGTLLIAPFRSENRWAILRNMRIELIGLWVKIPDARYEDSVPIPIYPTVYWQWGGPSSQKRSQP